MARLVPVSSMLITAGSSYASFESGSNNAIVGSSVIDSTGHASSKILVKHEKGEIADRSWVMFATKKKLNINKVCIVTLDDLISISSSTYGAAPAYYSNQNYYDNSETSDNAAAMFLDAYQSCISAEKHNKLLTNDNFYGIYFLYKSSYSKPYNSSSTSLRLMCCEKKNLGKMVYANRLQVDNKEYSRSIFQYHSWDSERQAEGFYLEAGWMEESKYCQIPYTKTGEYVKVKANGMYSKKSTDLTLSDGYTAVYELKKSGDKYYTLVSSNDSNNTNNGNSAGNIVVVQDAIDPLDLSIGTGAVFLPQDYIDNFKNWKVNFIPNQIPVTDGSTDQPTKDGVEIYKQDNNHILTIKSNRFGTKNSNFYATDKSAKMLLVETKHDEENTMLEYLTKFLEQDAETDERCKPQIILKLELKPGEDGEPSIKLLEYFKGIENDPDYYRGKYNFVYYKNEEKLDINFKNFLLSNETNLRNYLEKEKNTPITFSIDIALEQEQGILNLYNLKLFEAFSRGHDFIQESYTSVRAEELNPADKTENSRIMEFGDNYFTYKYTGRDIDIFGGQKNKTELYHGTVLPEPIYLAAIHSCDLLQETDVTLGDIYGEQQYFAEVIRVPERKLNSDGIGYIHPPEYKISYQYKDTFKVKDYLDIENGGFDPTVYTDDDIQVVTGKIDLTRCSKYAPLDATFDNDWCDCRYYTRNDGTAATECIYQKLGYCPYRFETEKHPRRIRTLQQSKSNRFNIIQELSKVFEFYPYFYIEHEKNGKIKLNEDGTMKKHIFFMTEKGNNQKFGFRYEKNLSNITRTTDSSSITTKLYVNANDSSYDNDGLCSIDTAPDNLSKTNYILDFSYYVKIGVLDADQVQRDLYGVEKNDFAFLNRMGKLNELYDKYSNLIITMTGETLTELQAEIEVSSTGIETALEERKKIAQKMYQYKAQQQTLDKKYDVSKVSINNSYTISDTYKNYVEKYREQATILWGLVEQLFFSGNYFSMPRYRGLDNADKEIYEWITIDIENLGNSGAEKAYKYLKNTNKYCKEEIFWYLILEDCDDFKNAKDIELQNYKPIFNKWTDFQEKVIDTHAYPINGSLGKYKKLYNQVVYWKTERAKILNKINDLYEQFYKKYEPYIKEGTFSDSNYITDNEYYWAAVQVLDDSCEPKITYTLDVIDISPLPEHQDDYVFDLADTTFIEDIDFFGINSHTGLPNKEKVIVTSTTEYPDEPKKNKIDIKNYTSKFSDLFQAITASVQSLTFNENIYKRASNFTAKQYVETESLQSTLDIGDLTLIDAPKNNIVIDESGTEGNDINNTASQYKLTGEGLFFSTDGGETWDLGVGPKGFNLDYAKFGSLDASKVQIVDGNYIYFLWDKDGINAYRNPAKSTTGLVDFARFNKYGLSLIEKEVIRLRAGYEYKSSADGNNQTGNYKEELDLTDQNIGFYLYNDKGQPIFKTETRSLYSEDPDSNYTTRLSLTGEIFATNKILNSGNNLSSGTVTSTVNEYKGQVILNDYINENSNIRPDFDIDIVKQLLNTGENDTTSYITIPEVINKKMIKDGERIYIYGRSSYIKNDDIAIGVILTKYTLPSVVFSIETDINDDDIIDLENWFIKLENDEEITEEDVANIMGIDVNNVIDITSTNREISAYNSYNITTGYAKAAITEKLYITENPNATIQSNSVALKQTVGYRKDKNDADITTESLYILTDNSGNITYWRTFVETKQIITTNNTANGEVGVYINNKKALELQEKGTTAEDLTDFRSWNITPETPIDEFYESISTLYGGAERVFSIITGREEGTSIAINNILTVLKNGVLYMGGTITNKLGQELDIDGLSYLPDEIKIQNPAIVMSNTGQIWCDWDQFFYARKDESTGYLVPTRTSLLQVFKNIQKWSGNVSSSSSGVTVSGYFIDEADVDANA